MCVCVEGGVGEIEIQIYRRKERGGGGTDGQPDRQGVGVGGGKTHRPEGRRR